MFYASWSKKKGVFSLLVYRGRYLKLASIMRNNFYACWYIDEAVLSFLLYERVNMTGGNRMQNRSSRVQGVNLFYKINPKLCSVIQMFHSDREKRERRNTGCKI